MSINLMDFYSKGEDKLNVLDRIYERFNIEKSLVNAHKKTNLETLQRVLDEQIRSKIDSIRKIKKENRALADYLHVAYYVAHARLVKLLYSTEGREISADSGSELGKEVIKMLEKQEDLPSDRYLGYFNALATKIEEPLTYERLDARALDVLDTSDFSKEASYDERKVILQAAYSTLSALIAEDGGIIEEPQKLMDVMLKSFYLKNDEELSEDEKAVYKQIKDAEIKASYDFLPKILLSPENGRVNKETIAKRYAEFLKADIQLNNENMQYRKTIETIYQTILLSVIEKGGEVSKVEADSIRDTYNENIPRVENQVIVSMLLDSSDSFTIEELDEKLKELMEGFSDEKQSTEDRMQLKTIYGALVDTINKNGGSAKTSDLKYAMSQLNMDLEVFREHARKANRSPFKLYPVTSNKEPEEIYEEKLAQLEKELDAAIEKGDIQGAKVILATANVYKELIEPAKNVDKRREEELVKYEVDATKGKSKGLLNVGICDIQLIRLGQPEDIINMENCVGDTIAVSRVGRFGFAATRKNDGKPLYTDNMSTQEYLVTKTYNSRAKEGEAPEVKTFRVFSSTLIPREMTRNDDIYSIYANQIFSDLSLEAAEKYNGGLIASVSPDVVRKDGTRGTEISFDPYTLSACIELGQRMGEYDRAEAKEGISRRKVKGVNNRLALIGNSNVELENGYASRIFLHQTGREGGEEPKEDVLFAFEWSDIEKDKTILDIVRNADIRSL